MLRIILIALITLQSSAWTYAQIGSEPSNGTVMSDDKDTLGQKSGFIGRILNSPLKPTADLRTIDGISLGLSYKIDAKESGSFQKIKALHSLSTRSFVIEYEADWKKIFGSTDLTVKALADMQGNIMNFFGRGNDTEFDQTGDFRKFYRVNFSFYEFRPALRFNLRKGVSITTGPSIQYFVNGNNDGRYFNTPAVSSSFNDLYADKLHGGLFLDFNVDSRDNKLLPAKGLNFNVVLQGFEGLNASSQAFAQVFSQLSLYKSLDSRGIFVIANRLGGGLTSGNPGFYQAAFLGSQDNLLGFRKNRFAGDHVIYNNLEGRITLPNFLHKIMPGKIGLIGFYDVGRVWVKNESSNAIHQGIGAGVFISPLNRLLLRGVAGYSNEGLQPTVSLRQRF